MTDCADNLLFRHQAVLCELLDVLDAVCQKHNIQYMLFAGSALGAVRHHGIIPWDDDLDIVMLRPEYERFIKIAPRELDLGHYYLQTEHSEHWPMFFSKLRKNKTACLERYIAKDKQMHQGIYIDIFPCDNLSDNYIVRKLQFLASKVIIAKSLDRRGYLTDSHIKKMFILICRLFPHKPLAEFVKRQKEDTSKFVHTFFGGASRYEKNIYPREWFEKSISLPFEDGKYPVSAFYDELLTQLYGDYMMPLPESQRGSKVHSDIVDVNHSYELYLDEQQKAQFSEYTRSIR